MGKPLGILGSRRVAWVEADGAVQPVDRPWRVAWWVASEERWHRPERDASLRQRLVDDLPIVETALRGPGGDAIATAYGFAGTAGRPEFALGVTNDSAVPIVVAVVIGPAT